MGNNGHWWVGKPSHMMLDFIFGSLADRYHVVIHGSFDFGFRCQRIVVFSLTSSS